MSYDAWKSRDEDFSLRPIGPEDVCDYCHALDTEPHQEDCPLFHPVCACGKSARRYLHGEPICAACQRRMEAA